MCFVLEYPTFPPKSKALNMTSSLIFTKYNFQALQDFLNQSKEWDILNYRFPDIDLQLEDFKDLVDDLRCCNEGSQQSWRQYILF